MLKKIAFFKNQFNLIVYLVFIIFFVCFLFVPNLKHIKQKTIMYTNISFCLAMGISLYYTLFIVHGKNCLPKIYWPLTHMVSVKNHVWGYTSTVLFNI